MQPKPGALQQAVRAKDVDQIKAIIRVCQNRRQLDDIDGDGRTALMVATVGGDHMGSAKVDHDIARQMMQLIWNRYRQLGCDLRDMLLYEHQGVYEQWNLLQHAAKYSCEDNLELIFTYYEYAFPREGLEFFANPKYLDLNHVAVWAQPIISDRIFSKSCEKKTHGTRSSCGAAATGARVKAGPSQKTTGQNSSGGSEDINTDSDNSSLGDNGNDSIRERTPPKKRAPESHSSDKKRAPNSTSSDKAKAKKHRAEVEHFNFNQAQEEEIEGDAPHGNKKKNRSKVPVREGNNEDVHPSQQPSPVYSHTTQTNHRNDDDDDDEEEEILETFPSSEQLGSCVKTLGRLLEVSLNRNGEGDGTKQGLLKTILLLTKHITDPSHRLSLTTLLSTLRDSIGREVGNNEDQLVLVQAMLAVVGPN